VRLLGAVFRASFKYLNITSAVIKRDDFIYPHRWRFTRLVLTEMIMRCVKNVIRGVMRRTTNELHLKTEVLLHFNRLLGEGPSSELYFDLLVRSQLILKFEPGKELDHLQRKVIMTPDVKLQLYHTLQVNLGLSFAMHVLFPSPSSLLLNNCRHLANV